MSQKKCVDTENIVGCVAYMQMIVQINTTYPLIILHMTIIFTTPPLYHPIFTHKRILVYQVNYQIFHFKQSLEMYKPSYMCVCLSTYTINPYEKSQQE